MSAVVTVQCPKCQAAIEFDRTVVSEAPPDKHPLMACPGCGHRVRLDRALEAKARREAELDRRSQKETKRRAETQRQEEAKAKREQDRQEQERVRRERDLERQDERRRLEGLAAEADAQRRRQQQEGEEHWRAADPEGLRHSFAPCFSSLCLFAFLFPPVAPIVAAILISGTRLPHQVAKAEAYAVLWSAGAALVAGLIILAVTFIASAA